MKVIGWLERAQFENYTPGTLPGPTSTGRIYADITTPTAAVPRFYNGSAWIPFALGQTTPFIANTIANKAVTVNWANGLNQQVILTAHTTISFSNPQPGFIHKLAVTQIATEGSITPWMYCLSMPDQYTRRQQYVQSALIESSGSHLYSWLYSPGIKSAYATVPAAAADPSGLPAEAAIGISIHPKLGVVTIGQTTSGALNTCYDIFDVGKNFIWGEANQFAPGTAAASVKGVKYAPDGQAIAFALVTTPFIQVILLDGLGHSTGSNNYNNPVTLPTGAGQCVDVSPSGLHAVVGHTTTPFMSVYLMGQRTLTKVTNPVTLPAAQVNAVAFSPTGDFIASGCQTTPFIRVWPFDTVSGFGTAVTNPGTLPAGGPPGSLGKGICWHPAGTFIAMTMATAPFLVVYPFNRNTGTLGTPTTPFATGAPAATLNCVQWSPCGNYLLAGGTAGTFLYIYDMSAGAGLPSSAPITFDGSNPGIQVNDITIAPSGEYFILALNTTPFIKQYPMPRKVKNYLKLMD